MSISLPVSVITTGQVDDIQYALNTGRVLGFWMSPFGDFAITGTLATTDIAIMRDWLHTVGFGYYTKTVVPTENDQPSPAILWIFEDSVELSLFRLYFNFENDGEITFRTS